MRRFILCAATLSISGAILLSGGCAVGKRQPVQISYYLIGPEFAPEAALQDQPCVVIRPVFAQASFREPQLVYRVTEVKYETDYYNRFMSSPPSQLTESISKWADSLDWTICPEEDVDMRMEHYVLRPVLEALYGDFRNKSRPAAHGEMQFTLSHVIPDCKCSKVRLSKLYTARVPLEESSPTALVKAQGRVIEEILGQLKADLSEILQ